MLLKNARALLCGDTLSLCDIRIENGKIVKISEHNEAAADSVISGENEVYNLHGLTVLPAFTDIHCHLRDPGYEYKEDIDTGTLAAAYGGYRAVCAMPNTMPPADNPDTLKYILEKAARTGHTSVFPAACITRGQAGAELVDFDALSAAGAAAFTDDGRPVTDNAVMYAAMKECAEHGYLIITHPECLELTAGGVMNDGETSRHLGFKGNPNIAEDLMIIRDIALAEATGCRLHVAHISTRGGMQAVREAKARGVRVTAETCPHYFSLCDEDVAVYGSNAKMSPPLRSRADVAAVIEALRDGTVDCISTDHAPHSDAEKSQPFEKCPNGIIGIQTAFSAAITYLVNPGHITLGRLCELLAYNPAEILGHPVALTIGADANLCAADTNETYTVTRALLRSKSANTPYIGTSLCGTIKMTIRNGKIEYAAFCKILD